MPLLSVNIWALAAAVIAKQALAYVWYRPGMFGRGYPREHLLDLALPADRVKLLLEILCSLLMAIGLTAVLLIGGVDSWSGGLLVGLGCWLVFVLPSLAGPVLFEGRPARWFVLQNGFLIIAFGMMGAILGAWA